jgi:transcriptional regulator
LGLFSFVNPINPGNKAIMYVPSHFSVTEQEEMFSFLDANAFGQLISVTDHRLTASHLPLEGQQVLVTFQGPHDYISPSWYQTPGVPTWNYQALHIYGRGRVFEEPEAIATVVEALSTRYESGFDEPWEPEYRDAMLKAIVGVEIEIEELQCKYKLSQNRPTQDHQPVIDKLDELGSESLVQAMRKALL